jgi:hypothetical protein
VSCLVGLADVNVTITMLMLRLSTDPMNIGSHTACVINHFPVIKRSEIYIPTLSAHVFQTLLFYIPHRLAFIYCK